MRNFTVARKALFSIVILYKDPDNTVFLIKYNNAYKGFHKEDNVFYTFIFVEKADCQGGRATERSCQLRT